MDMITSILKFGETYKNTFEEAIELTQELNDELETTRKLLKTVTDQLEKIKEPTAIAKIFKDLSSAYIQVKKFANKKLQMFFEFKDNFSKKAKQAMNNVSQLFKKKFKSIQSATQEKLEILLTIKDGIKDKVKEKVKEIKKSLSSAKIKLDSMIDFKNDIKEKIKKSVKNAIISLKLNFSMNKKQIPKVIKIPMEIIGNIQGKIKSIKKSLTSMKLKLSINKKNIPKAIKIPMKVIGNIQGKIKSIKKSLGILSKGVKIGIRLQKLTGNIFGKLGLDKLKEKIGKIFSNVKSAAIDKIKSKIGGIGGALVSLGKDVAKAAFNGAVSRENDQMSMENAMMQSNPGIGRAEAEQKSAGYMEKLKASANTSVFSEEEVLGAGSAALRAAKGDTGRASEIMELAQDMAASSPGKTLEEAISALADAQNGSMDALSDFGVTATEEDLQKAGGNVLKMTNSTGQSMTDTFKGGDERAGDTVDGKLKKIQGIKDSLINDIGSASLGRISMVLGIVVDFLTQNQAKISSIVVAVTEAFGKVFDFVFQGITWLKGGFDVFLGYLESKKDSFSGIFENLMIVIDQVKGVWNTAFPVIQDVLSTTWEIVKPIFDALFSYIGMIASEIAALASIIGWVATKIIIPVFKAVFDFIAPLVGGIIGFISSIIQGFTGLYTIIADFIKNVFKMDVPEKPEIVDTPPIIEDKSIKSSPMLAVEPSISAMPSEGIGYVPYDNYTSVMSPSEKTLNTDMGTSLVSTAGGKGVNISIPKLADTINASDVGDVDKLLARLEEKLLAVAGNMGVA